MKVKEKILSETAETAVKKTVPEIPKAAAVFISAFFGFLAAGTSFGGGAPLCSALAAVLSPVGGIAAFAGSMAEFLIDGTVGEYLTEIISVPAIILSKLLVTVVFGKTLSERSAGILAGAAYFVCGTMAALSFKITVPLIFAVAFRGVLCGAAAYFASSTLSAAKKSITEKGFSVGGSVKISAAVTYAAVICMLCGIRFGTVDMGRTVGAFFTAAAAYKLGGSFGAGIGALTAFGAGVSSSGMLISSPILVCSGLLCGSRELRKKGRLATAAVFIGAGLGGALIFGMPSDALKLLSDMSAAAVIFFFLPDKMYKLPSMHSAAVSSPLEHHQGSRLKFAAAAVSDVRESFSKAIKVLDRGERKYDVSSEVCGKVCSMCRSSALCGEDNERRIGNYFRPAESILEEKGYISETELHKSLECCPHKNALAEAFNRAYRKAGIEKRMSETADNMREVTEGQLESFEKMLEYLSRRADILPACDEALSEYVRSILAENGAKNPSAAVFFDECGRLYIECFYSGAPKINLCELTEKLSYITDRALDESPEAVSVGGVTRLCFCEETVFTAEIGSARVNGREDTSGDFGTVFRDGFGNVSVLLSDGMGSGARAAVESCMTVSLMTRILRAGLGAEAAVELINLLLLTKSAEECFSTVDLFTVNLFSGKAEIIKLGAAQTFIKTGGTVKTIESRSTPVGIVGSVEISRYSARLSDGDEAVLITDGICESVFPRVRELMMSIGVTAQDCAERIIASAENEKGDDLYMQDDKTVYVVKIHKI